MVNNKINVNVIDGLQPILDRIVDYDNITNCITEIPQDIKLELNNGTLTLKAGSKVYIPNGKNADGSLRFDVVVVDSDVVHNYQTTTTGQTMVFLYPSRAIGAYFYSGDGISQGYYSGSTAPSGNTYMTWYDTTNNFVKYTDNGGSTWTSGCSLPIAIGSYTNAWVSIDQVFNGFGYIGSHIWMGKGVKLLVANGINDDGTIKNEEIVTPNVIVARGLAAGTRSDLIPFLRKYPTNNQLQLYPIAKANFLGELDYVPTVGAGFQWYFNTSEMKWYMHEAGATEWVSAPYYNISPTITVVNNVITSFQPYKPFRAVDQNDFNKLDEEVVKTSGNQTIDGIKTFSIVGIRQKSTGFAKGNAVETDTLLSRLDYLDKNNVPMIQDYNYIRNSDDSTSYIKRMYLNTVDGGYRDTIVSIYNKDNGLQLNFQGNNGGVLVPTPTTNDNSTKAANTEWVNNKHQVVTALPSSPAAGVFYFIKE